MCRLARQKSNKANSSTLYLPAKGYFREKYKSQNINPISPTPKSTMSTIKTIVKSYQLFFIDKINEK